MATRDITSALSDWVRWLYYKPWEWFELLSVGLIVLALLLIFVSKRQDAKRLRKSMQNRQLPHFRGL